MAHILTIERRLLAVNDAPQALNPVCTIEDFAKALPWLDDNKELQVWELAGERWVTPLTPRFAFRVAWPIKVIRTCDMLCVEPQLLMTTDTVKTTVGGLSPEVLQEETALRLHRYEGKARRFLYRWWTFEPPFGHLWGATRLIPFEEARYFALTSGTDPCEA